MKRIDLTGRRFGRLVVKGRVGFKNHNSVWRCECDCGKSTTVLTGHLKSGDTKSCGCLHDEMLKTINIKHGLRNHPLYTVWADMLQRCKNPNMKCSPNYSKRGISVCVRWEKSFKDFLEDMGECPAGYTLERVNTNGDYTPSNCTWASRADQNRNSRRSKRWFLYGKKFKSAALAAKYFNVSRQTIRNWCKSKQDYYSLHLYPKEAL